MSRALVPLGLALALAACSQDNGNDVAPLPEPTAAGANNLMAEAERAAANAAKRAEPNSGSARSAGETNNEVTP
ncbi:hypothetical protein GCM10022281_19630 [Sphingomonas rosea]|uniref:Lipoprotein n=1 Tax=Sphingomonas rosea TaxID=335605 RepID=A0ABP7UAM4_9SPHN